jgi:glycosyltransferase involved in cell wall biosynthesis
MPKGQMRLYQHAARLQAVSEAVAESIGREVPACLPKVRVIPNALPSSFVRASQAASNVVERRNVILYAGRIHPEKGIDLLVNAFETLPPDVRSGWQLWIMGPSEATGGGAGGAYREGLRRSAVKSRDSIRWLEPAYADEDLARRYTEAKIFVYPSVAERGESFGMAPLEAMLCGCAVIVSRLRCFSEFLEEGVNGLSFNHAGASAVADLSNQLRRLMQQPELGRSLAERAAVNAMKFSAESVAERHLLDFEELLSGVVPAPVRA